MSLSSPLPSPLHGVCAVARREFRSYFTGPLAAIFLVIFLALSAALPFYLGGFFDRNQASLDAFFAFHPWLYLVLMPAIGMRLWAEERRGGTMELLMVLPVRTGALVLGKFLAAWGFATLALALTVPMWLVVNWLGSPDNGVILAGYIGSWLLAGAMLAVCALVSATTRNQVIAFILGAVACFLLLASGLDLVLDGVRALLPAGAAESVADLSLLTHAGQMFSGALEASAAVYFASLIGLALVANTLVVDLNRAR